MEILPPVSKLTRRQAFEELQELARKARVPIPCSEFDELDDAHELFGDYAFDLWGNYRGKGVETGPDMTFEGLFDQFVFVDDSSRLLERDNAEGSDL